MLLDKNSEKVISVHNNDPTSTFHFISSIALFNLLYIEEQETTEEQ